MPSPLSVTSLTTRRGGYTAGVGGSDGALARSGSADAADTGQPGCAWGRGRTRCGERARRRRGARRDLRALHADGPGRAVRAPAPGRCSRAVNRARIQSPSCIEVASSGELLMNASSACARSAAVARFSRFGLERPADRLRERRRSCGATFSIGSSLPSRIARIAATASPRGTMYLPASSSHSTMREREHVAAAVERRGDRLLGRHVRVLALDLARGSSAGRPRAAAFAMPKSHSFTTPSNDDHDVRRRDVAVDEPERLAVRTAQLVRVVQRVRGVGADARDQRRRQLLAARRA